MSESTVYAILCGKGKRMEGEGKHHLGQMRTLAYKAQDDPDDPRIEVMLNQRRAEWRSVRIELGRHVAFCTDGCKRAPSNQQAPVTLAWERGPTHNMAEMPSNHDIAAMLRDGADLAALAKQYGRSESTVRRNLNDGGWDMYGQPMSKARRAIAAAPRRSDEWMDRALCAQTDPEAFFPETCANPKAAKRICAACPVREACLDDALTGDDHGVRGGLSRRERRALKPGWGLAS